jgi:hypothetical protein
VSVNANGALVKDKMRRFKGEGAHFLTINAPLILKMRDIIFFCGQTT